MALKQLPIFFCAECGNPDYRTQPNKIFCSGTCRQAQWNRRVTGGFRLYELTMAWRIDRNKGDMAELTAAADQLAAEERIIRRRREANIIKQRAALAPGSVIADEMPEHVPGKSVNAAVTLPEAQQRALADAGLFALACAAGRVPNDPDARPEGWPVAKLAALRNGVITLGGQVEETEL
jgi:endogenous inhibitor of DNA gyrase (YacG/DUF329 family)